VRESLSVFGVPGNDQSFRAKFTPDGRYSVFYSLANNLVPDDFNNQLDIFRKDLKTGEIIRVSTHVGGTQIASGVPTDAYNLDISPDGRYVLFSTTKPLVYEDNNGLEDVYMKDLATQAITRIVGGGGVLEPFNGSFVERYNGSASARFSPDGKYVVFESSRLIDPADPNDPNDDRYQTDIFRKNLATGQIDRISVGANNQQGDGLSWDAKYTPDGRYVIFSSIADGLIPFSGASQVLRKDLQTGALEVISTNAARQAGTHHSLDAQISANGRYVVFASHASNLVPNDKNSAFDIFRKDLVTGEIVGLTTNRTGVLSSYEGHGRAPQISADGRYVVFSLAKNREPNELNGPQDIFRKDMVTGEIVRISATATGAQGQGTGLDAHSYNPQISPDGRYISFDSYNTLVPYDTHVRDVFVTYAPISRADGILGPSYP
jgi:Tol biopolymer transport system component